MPRKARIIADGGYYHILTRGNNRKAIFLDNQDYCCFLEIIKAYLSKFQVFLMHYCLMPNHVHFLVRLKKAPDLAKFIQAILQVYANYYRKKYNSVGYTFQNRYVSHPIESDIYLLECARYIERNPLRANIANNLIDYRFSSFSFYVQGHDEGIVNCKNPLYLGLGESDSIRRQLYKDYIGVERPYDSLIDRIFRLDKEMD